MVMHPVGGAAAAPMLPVALQRVLADVLRLLQQERTQMKGQRPCRRPSRSLGSGVEAEATNCLLDAARALSPTAAADVLATFLTSHPAPGSPDASTMLVGTALAELVLMGHTPTCAVPTLELLVYLDAAVSVGHPGAMQCVAVCLRDGRAAVPQDAATADTWLRCAATSGYLPAVHELGETYERGMGHGGGDEGGAADWGEAMRWYRVAAEAGYAASQLNLGKLLLTAAEHAQLDNSAGAVQVDHLRAEARRWLRACAAAGVAEAVRLVQRLDEEPAPR